MLLNDYDKYDPPRLGTSLMAHQHAKLTRSEILLQQSACLFVTLWYRVKTAKHVEFLFKTYSSDKVTLSEALNREAILNFSFFGQ